jgi:hypothetical protein
MVAIDCPCGHRLEAPDEQIRARIDAGAYEAEQLADSQRWLV